MVEKIDARELRLVAISSLLVATVFGYAVHSAVISPPIHRVVIYEVWKVEHPGGFTDIYTVGQGIFSFYGYHQFEVGRSYRVIYVEQPTASNRLACKLLSMEEVNLPG